MDPWSGFVHILWRSTGAVESTDLQGYANDESNSLGRVHSCSMFSPIAKCLPQRATQLAASAFRFIKDVKRVALKRGMKAFEEDLEESKPQSENPLDEEAKSDDG